MNSNTNVPAKVCCIHRNTFATVFIFIYVQIGLFLRLVTIFEVGCFGTKSPVFSLIFLIRAIAATTKYIKFYNLPLFNGAYPIFAGAIQCIKINNRIINSVLIPQKAVIELQLFVGFILLCVNNRKLIA